MSTNVRKERQKVVVGIFSLVTSSSGILDPVFFIEGEGWQNQTHGGYIGHFKIPVRVELNGWWIALVYEQPIAEIEAWQGVHFKSSPDRRILYIRQITWNRRQYPGMIMDQRYLINFQKLSGVDYSDYYGPRPVIVFLDKVYIPDPIDNNEHEMTVVDLDEYDLPSYLEMLPVNIVTTPEPAFTTTTAPPLTRGPNSGMFWWVRTNSRSAPTTARTTPSTAPPSTTTTTTTASTTAGFTVSCQRAIRIQEVRCRRANKPQRRCYIPQCSSADIHRFRVVQCWKYKGACWCVNPTIGTWNRNRQIVRYKNAHTLDCFAAPSTTTSTEATATTTTRATLPTRPPGSDPLTRPLFAPRSNYDYKLVLHNSLLFFEAQRSGDIGDNGRVFWRRSAHLNDGSDCRFDLSGGYYVSGDYVKYGYPTAAAMTMMAWGFLEFKDAYDENWETHFLKEALKWGTDYFIKAHVGRNVFVGQVGDSRLENTFWLRPQDMRVRRPCFTITERNPGSDLAGETAAALAATAKVWLTTGSEADDPYVRELLRHARELYDFAVNYRGVYSLAIRAAQAHYPSNSYGDELTWAALWLYEATGENRYLADAGRFYVEFGLDMPQGELSWETKTVAVQLLLAKYAHRSGAANAADRYLSRVSEFCSNIRPGAEAEYTPQGLLFLSEWGTTRYACNAAFACTVASTLPALDHNLKRTFREFAENQVDYILGKTGRSFVVGYGRNFPMNPHHRASSCSMAGECGWDAYHSNTSNPQLLNGALVGGPNIQDYYEDNRINFKSNGVGLDFNAGLQGVVAGLRHFQLEYSRWMTYTRQEVEK